MDDTQAVWTEPTKSVTDGMQQFWTNVAKYGIPGSAKVNDKSVKWNEYTTEHQETMFFTVNGTMMYDNYDNKHCQFWDNLGYNWLYYD